MKYYISIIDTQDYAFKSYHGFFVSNRDGY